MNRPTTIFRWQIQITQGGQVALVFGNEVKGISDEVLSKCDEVIEIPQFGTKHSLNISVTAGIAIWEFSKQAIKKGEL